MLPLLFAGGFITKIAVIALTAGLLTSGVSCAFKTVDLKMTKAKVEKLEVRVQQVETDNAILKQNNTTLKDNLDKAADANGKTVEANGKLLTERRHAQAAIDALAKSRAAERRRAEEADRKIKDMLKDPANNGPIAPVLRETIRDIQSKKVAK